MADDSKPLKPGVTIAGKYVIDGLLAEGAMGSVYLAEQEPMGRRVALKVIRRDLVSKPIVAKRFLREAVAVSKLEHPNTVTLFDFGRSEDGLAYLAMQLVEGTPLNRVLARDGTLSVRRTVRIVSQIGLSLAEAHRKGVVHRDLKPANVMIVDLDGQPDFVKVIDFGVAQLVDRRPGERITESGMTCGTPEYMAPEQLARDAVADHRCDLYALGIIAYELLEGHRPFPAPTVVAGMVRKYVGEPEPMSEPVPKALGEFIMRLIARDPNERPATAEAMLVQLKEAVPPGVRLPLELETGRSSTKTKKLELPVGANGAIDLSVMRPDGPTESDDWGGIELASGADDVESEAEDTLDETSEAPDHVESDGPDEPTPLDDDISAPMWAGPAAMHAHVVEATVEATPSASKDRLLSTVLGLIVLALGGWGVYVLAVPGDAGETELEAAGVMGTAASPDETNHDEAGLSNESEPGDGPLAARHDPEGVSPQRDSDRRLQAATSQTASSQAAATDDPPQDLPQPTAAAPVAVPRQPQPLGARCGERVPCESGNCNHGVCAPPGYVYIAPAQFTMGREGAGDERAHPVTITRGFYLSQHEVTQREWLALMDRMHTEVPNCGPECPAENERWERAATYLNALSQSEGLEACYEIGRHEVDWPRGIDCPGYRFPTEAEWEYAARAGVTMAPDCIELSAPPDGCLEPVAWYRDNAGGTTHRVGEMPPNALGLYDVIGNAWEWVWDRYGPYEADRQIDPTGPPRGEYNVRRGCSYRSTSSACALTGRNTYSRAGLRPARSVPVVGVGEASQVIYR